MNENEQKQQGLQIELTPDVAQGEYANFVIITHSSSDFRLCRRTSCAMSTNSVPSNWPTDLTTGALLLPSPWEKVRHNTDSCV